MINEMAQVTAEELILAAQGIQGELKETAEQQSDRMIKNALLQEAERLSSFEQQIFALAKGIVVLKQSGLVNHTPPSEDTIQTNF